MARRRHVSQRLLGSTLESSADVVAWLGAVQAQDYAGAKWALGIRAPGLTDADLERAFASGAILRTHVLRPTWHFVTPADIRWMLALTAPRVHAANAYMYRKLELDSATFRRCDAVLTVADARNGLATNEATFESEHIDGKTYWSAAPSVPLTERGSTAHLVSIYDEYVSGYKDRSAIVSATNGTRVMAMGNALTSIVVVNGQIRGTWRRRIDKGTVEVSIAMFDRLTKAEDRAVNAALQEFGAFVGKTTVRR